MGSLSAGSLRILCISVIAGFLAQVAPLSAQGQFRRAEPADRIPGQYIILFNDGVSSEAVPALAQELAAQHGGQIRGLLQYAARGFSANLTEEQAIRLSQDAGVKLVEENARVHLSTEQILPADNSLWGLDRIDQTSATSDYRYWYCEKASGVIVYVLDTGINKKHQEFLNGKLTRVLNGVKFASDTYIWPGDAADYGTWPCGAWTDNYAAGHGTSVASIIGGKTVGVAKEVRLVPLRAFNCQGAGTVEYLCWALDWIKGPSNPNRNFRPALVNISLRIATSEPLVGAFEAVVNGVVLDSQGWTGITVVASANNQNTNEACSSPARMAYRNTAFVSPGRVISVGGTQEGDIRWQCAGAECFLEYGCGSPFPDTNAASNYGPIVDIYAPAHNIESAHISCSTCRRTLATTRSGTSFSAAIVSGLVARILQANPTFTPTQVWSQLQADATVVSPPIDPLNGNGLLAHRAGAAVCNPELP
jgi:subtilisin family serine protease